MEQEPEVELEELSDAHRDDYSFRYGGLYVEFTDVQWSDRVLSLLGKKGDYMSVRHDTDTRHDISEEMRDRLLAIRDE